MLVLLITLSLYSSFIMLQLKKVGGSCGGMLSTLVTVWIVSRGTESPVAERTSLVCSILFDWATKVCFSHRKNLGVTVRAELLRTSTEIPTASPVYFLIRNHQQMFKLGQIRKICAVSGLCKIYLPCFTPIFSEVTFIVTLPGPRYEILVAHCCS